MTTVIEQFELTNTCTCESIDECWGDCYELELSFINERLEKWADQVGGSVDHDFLIATNGMNWDRVSGMTRVPFNEIINSLSINSEWRLVFKFENDSARVVRYSHDEPTGATFYLAVIVD